MIPTGDQVSLQFKCSETWPMRLDLQRLFLNARRLAACSRGKTFQTERAGQPLGGKFKISAWSGAIGKRCGQYGSGNLGTRRARSKIAPAGDLNAGQSGALWTLMPLGIAGSRYRSFLCPARILRRALPRAASAASPIGRHLTIGARRRGNSRVFFLHFFLFLCYFFFHSFIVKSFLFSASGARRLYIFFFISLFEKGAIIYLSFCYLSLFNRPLRFPSLAGRESRRRGFDLFVYHFCLPLFAVQSLAFVKRQTIERSNFNNYSRRIR